MTLPVVVYLRGAGARERTWERVTAAVAARGWHPVNDERTAWHLARGGCRTVLCDFTPTYGGGLTKETVTVQTVHARYNLSREIDQYELAPRRDWGSGEFRRPTQSSSTRALDVEALMVLIERAVLGVDPVVPSGTSPGVWLAEIRSWPSNTRTRTVHATQVSARNWVISEWRHAAAMMEDMSAPHAAKGYRDALAGFLPDHMGCLALTADTHERLAEASIDGPETVRTDNHVQ